MNPVRLAIERPTAVLAGVLMIILFGIVALQAIPIQLTPDLSQPVISIRTNWPGAAPAETEREVVIRQEEVLRGLEGLEEMRSESKDGSAEITLEFAVGQNMDKALLLVANRLDQVDGYPEEADEPSLDTAGSDDQAIAWFILRRAEGNERPVHTYGDFAKEVLRDRLERAPGISRVNVFGGQERELKVIVEPTSLVKYGLTIPDVLAALRTENISLTAGDVEEGKRRYIVRSEAELKTPEAVRQVVLLSLEDPDTGTLSRITVGDVAEVRFDYKDPVAAIRFLGEPALALNATRRTGANVIETMEGLRQAVDELNRDILPREQLTLTQVYDETTYINSAIDLVTQNIWVGGTLAALTLLLFLRSPRAMLVVTLSIPVSIIGAFVAMSVLGRSLNVISLAGLAFAVGMVVDAAIVVLENIYRLRQRGVPAAKAAYSGTIQVWGAVFVSALTTVLVFVPILTMDLEVGQLFRDIAVAISVAVVLSLLVAVTVIPALANALLRRNVGNVTALRLPGIDPFAHRFVRAVTGLTRTMTEKRGIALGCVALLCATAGLGTYLFMPKLEYLPEGNRNLVFGGILPPPGYNLETMAEIAQSVEDAVSHLWAVKTGPEAEPGEPPKIENFFFVARPGITFVGGTAVQEERAGELVPVIRGAAFREPGTFGFVSQPSIFGREVGGGRRIDLNVSGPDLEEILGVAQRAMGKMVAAFPPEAGNQMRPLPGLELGAPEIRLSPNRMRLADNGLSAADFGTTVDAFNDGVRVAEITVGGLRMDLTLTGSLYATDQTQGVTNLPIITSSGRIVPVSSLADVVVTSGPTEIRHLERQRTITLQLRPAPEVPLEAALETLNASIVEPLRADGIPAGVALSLTGTADKLSQTWDAMVWQLAIAIAIVYLTMAVLFESFVLPLVIIVAVPLAAAGGIGGLAVLNLFVYQPLDMLTLLGFVILIGIVVNNAILLVHQTLHHMRDEGLAIADAIVESTRNRVRPIFMSTLTSIFGMLPLVLFPGAGSELYRGLGSVVVGGLSLSAVLTLAVVPPLLALILPLITDQPTTPEQPLPMLDRKAAE